MAATIWSTGILFGQDEETARLAVDGLINGREALITGQFTAVEWRWTGSPSDDIFARREIYCAFDTAEAQFRFDRTRKIRVTEWSGAAPKDVSTLRKNAANASSHIKVLHAKYIRLAEKSLHWSSRGRYQVTIKQPEDVLASAGPFRVDCVGVITTGDLRGLPDLQRLVDIFMGQDLRSVEKLENGEHLLVWDFADGSLRRRLWLDPRKDYAPTRMEILEAGNGPESSSFKLIVTTVTAWDRINNVWVPVKSTHFEDRQGKELKSYEIDFSWSRVNENVPDEVFSVAGLKLDRFARVVDTRLGVPVVVEKILPNNVKKRKTATPDAEAGNLNDMRTTSWLLWFNLSVIAALTMFLLFRKLRKGR
jgi:hypothetical protein